MWSGSPRRQQLPSNWSSITRRIKDRDGHRCTRCASTRRLEVDHIQRGGNHNDANLQTLCHSCHQAKTQSEAAAARPSVKRQAEQHPGLR